MEDTNAMSDKAHTAREMRARRAAKRQGLELTKSRTRDPRATDYGTYALVDPDTNTLVAAGLQSGYGLSLEEIERALDAPLTRKD